MLREPPTQHPRRVTAAATALWFLVGALLHTIGPVHAQGAKHPTPTAAAGQGSLRMDLRSAQQLLRSDFSAAISALEDIVDRASEMDRPAVGALAQCSLAFAILQRDGIAAGNAAIDLGIARLPASATAIDRANFQLGLCRFYHSAEQLAPAAIALREAQSIAVTLDDPRLSARCAVSQHSLMRDLGVGHDVSKELREATEVLATGPFRQASFLAAIALAEHAEAEGRQAEAERLRQEVHRQAKEDGDRWVQALHLAHQSDEAMYANDWPQAVRFGEEGVRVLEALGSNLRLAIALDWVAWVRALSKNPEPGLPLLDRARQLNRQIGSKEIDYRLLDTARKIATLHEDADRLLETQQQIEAHHLDLEEGARAKDRGKATSILTELRDAQATRRREDATKREMLRIQEQERERWLSRIRLIGGVIALLFTAGIAVVFFLGKRRAERMHARLQDQIQRTRTSEVARERLQQNLNQLERLEALGIFAAGFAHDFNNLLCSISGHAELARNRLEGVGPEVVESNETEREGLDAILSSAQKGKDLCQRLLDYSRPAAENAETNDVGRLMLEAKILLESSSEQTGELEVVPSPQALPVRIERAAFEQALVGIVTNARDKKVGATRVRLAARRSHWAPSHHDDGLWFGRLDDVAAHAIVDVRDDGCGIEPDRLRRLFDPFYTTKFEGRGLGLSAALGIVSAHGGAIHVTSDFNQGSCFAIWLPLAESTPAQPANSGTTPRHELGEPLKVLAIDDEPTILAYVGRAMRQSRHEVLTAETKQEAHAQLEHHSLDLDIVLLDLSMPDVDGMELFDYLGKQFPHLPLVVMSGHSQRFIEDRTRDYPVAAILQKPFPSDALHQALAQAAQAIERTG